MSLYNEVNPFQITTPEDLTAEETVKLFVDVFSDFYQITDPGHVLIKGPRGVGKSMMFRYLEPDCQILVRSKDTERITISDLPYIAIYIPLKNANFSSAELKKFDKKHAANILNEHIMITHCLSKIFDNLKKNFDLSEDISDEIKSFYTNEFCRILEIEHTKTFEDKNVKAMFQLMVDDINIAYKQVMGYIKRSAFSDTIEPYTDPLYDYIDYLVPLMEGLANVLSKQGTTFYLLLDDAHFLSTTQTRILNKWVSSRTSRKVSLKISTQYNYKSYYTTNGQTIDTPHDYSEIDIATIYTEDNKNAKQTYYGRIKDIVEKRLKMYNIDTKVEDFFPPDQKQEKEIKKIEEKYIRLYDEGKAKGYNRTDDARRYARPDFIKSLAGKSKSSYTYSYAGFDQLVNISSGIVRYFLQQAHSMYAHQIALTPNNQPLSCITPGIQNDIVRENANRALFDDLKEYAKEGHDQAYPKEDIEKLSNLIQGLGGLFRKILLSSRSERRVFSVAISDVPSESVLHILDIGLQLGYFHRSTIGRKESGSIGRTRLYVLNRRLAPIWNLDPNGFAGYLFVKNIVIENAIKNPMAMLKKAEIDFNIENNGVQLSLFDNEPDIDVGDGTT